MKPRAQNRLTAVSASFALAAALCLGAVFVAQNAMAQGATTGYHSIAVVKPAGGETVHDNAGNVDVKVAISPALDAAAGDRIALILDGRKASVRGATRFRITGVNRGEHTLEARVVDSGGEILISSGPVTFNMWQASRLFSSRHNN